MKLVPVLAVKSRMMAKSLAEALKRIGIPAELSEDAGAEAFRFRFGGGDPPFDLWVISVPEEKLQEAKEFLEPYAGM